MKAKLVSAVKAVVAAEIDDPAVRRAVRAALIVAAVAALKAFGIDLGV